MTEKPAQTGVVLSQAPGVLRKFMRSRVGVISVVVVFAVIGIAVLQFSKAAEVATQFEAEDGALSGPAGFEDASDASGGNAVRLWTGQEPMPTPSHEHEPTPPLLPTQIPPAQLPAGNAGSPNALIISGAPTGAPTPTWASAFRIECGYSHMNYDDAIVYPGQPGKAHLHTYFGNTVVNATTTYESLKSTGNSTCSGGILNRSAYWVPTMMSNGAPVAPTKSVVYYKSGYPSVPFATIQKLPDGLKMITGSAAATSSQNTGLTFVEWYCQSINVTSASIPNCNAGDELILAIDFPQCWDGVNLDSENHKSHMAMPRSWGGAGCPTTHPVPLPHITMLVHWPVTSGNTAAWRLSSDMYPTTSPGGFSAHADYIEGWDKNVKDTFVMSCLQAGKDCQVRWLGDGRSLVNPPGVN